MSDAPREDRRAPSGDAQADVVMGGERIRLRVLDQDALLERIIAEDGHLDARNPYFGQVWPAARVLGERIATATVEGLRVLDLGCGTGLLGIVAARRGARVTFADVMDESLRLARDNARENRVRGAFTRLDLREPPLPYADDERFELVVASDVLYEPWMAPALADFLDRVLAKDGRAWIADPHRPSGDGLKKDLRRHGFEVEIEEDLVEDAGKVHVVRTFLVRRGVAP